jgi:hypothetical protein
LNLEQNRRTIKPDPNADAAGHAEFAQVAKIKKRFAAAVRL